jgi:hypothetical protein
VSTKFYALLYRDSTGHHSGINVPGYTVEGCVARNHWCLFACHRQQHRAFCSDRDDEEKSPRLSPQGFLVAEDEELLARACSNGKHGGGSSKDDDEDDDICGDGGDSMMDAGDEALFARKFSARLWMRYRIALQRCRRALLMAKAALYELATNTTIDRVFTWICHQMRDETHKS